MGICASGFGRVADVLRMGGGAEVCSAVVESVAVNVVDEEVGWNVEYLAVHFDGAFFLCDGVPDLSLCVIGESAFVCVPFVYAESRVVFGVHDSEFALGEGDFSEGVAEAKASIEKDERQGEAFE